MYILYIYIYVVYLDVYIYICYPSLSFDYSETHPKSQIQPVVISFFFQDAVATIPVLKHMWPA